MVSCSECDLRGNCPLGEAGRGREGCWDGYVEWPHAGPENSAATLPGDDGDVLVEVVVETGILA